MNDPIDRPGVLVLPPIIFVVALLAGLALHRLFPLTLPLSAFLRWTGAALILAGLACDVVAYATFERAGTNVNPMKPAIALVRSGLFRFSRNPMYVGMTVAYVGLVLITRAGWLLILLPPALAILHWGVVLREERYLARKFDVEYDAYRAEVRRYF